MQVTVDLGGGETRTYVVDDGATHADLIRAVGYQPQEATILVDGAPVPDDAAIDADRVRLLRLIQGACESDAEMLDGAGSGARAAASEAVPTGITIENATPTDRLDIVRVLDAAMLQTDISVLAERIAADAVICARFERTGAVVGAVVVRRPATDTAHIDALAVRRARRGRGIGSALVGQVVAAETANEAVSWVTAGFDPGVKPFYRACGFVIAAGDDGRLVGRRRVTADDHA